MKIFQLNFGTIVLRYYLLMAVVLIAGFTGQWWLAFLSLPIFLSCLLAIRIDRSTMKKQTTSIQRRMHFPKRHNRTAA